MYIAILVPPNTSACHVVRDALHIVEKSSSKGADARSVERKTPSGHQLEVETTHPASAWGSGHQVEVETSHFASASVAWKLKSFAPRSLLAIVHR